MSGHLTERDLLKWSTSLQQATKSEDVQSQLTPEEIEERKKRLDPKWIDVILGRTDAMRMRESMEAVEASPTVDDKLTNMDNLETLLENLDNANDLTPLKLWTPLITLTTDPSALIRASALSCLGTAIQNNPKAQEGFLTYNGVELVLTGLLKETDASVVKKGVYCLSGFTQQNPKAFDVMKELGGWDFLLSLLAPNPHHAAIHKRLLHLFRSLVDQDDSGKIKMFLTAQKRISARVLNIIRESADVDTKEKGLELLSSLSGCFDDAEKKEIRDLVDQAKESGVGLEISRDS